MINNGKTLHTLIDFDFVVNTELGLIRLIREQYRDSRAFKLDILDKSDRSILSLLSSRNNSNPLSIISTEENMSDIDELYKDFIDTKYLDIIGHSVSSRKISTFVNMLIIVGKDNSGSDTSIHIHNDIQEKFIKTAFNVRGEKFDTSEILNFKDPLYVKDYTYFFEDKFLQLISYKNVYLYDRPYNVDYISNNNSILTRNNKFVTMKEI